MGTLITITIVILNIFGVFILLKMLTGTDMQFKIIATVVLLVVTLIVSNIIFGISSAGMQADLVAKSKPYMLFVLFPINVVAMAGPIAIQINKLQSKEVKQEEFLKKIIRLIVIDIVIIILECIYLKNIQMGIIKQS